MATPELVLGIDGGGTKTVAWVAPVGAAHGEDPLGRGHSGPGNPRAVGFETALANIGAAVDAAFADAGLKPITVAAACLALAGADRSAERSRIEAWSTQRQLALRLRVTNDAEPILAAGSADGWGIAVICGTGSFALGQNRQGQTARCGGWGYLFGDEGSGYAIALAGLRAAARAADGRGEPTALLDLFQKRLSVASPQELVEAIYRPEMQRQQIAELSEIVFSAADQRDAVACQITAQAADELVMLVDTLVQKLRLPIGEYPLAMAGGVLLNESAFRDTLVQSLTNSASTPGSIMLVPEPARGAVALARRAIRTCR